MNRRTGIAWSDGSGNRPVSSYSPTRAGTTLPLFASLTSSRTLPNAVGARVVPLRLMLTSQIPNVPCRPAIAMSTP